MDEWDRTIERFNKHKKFADGAGAQTLAKALGIRARLYGKDKLQKALSDSAKE